MASIAFYWLLLNFLSIIVQAFYSMTEMACVSFNRVRLHYYVSKGDRRAILLSELLHNPSKLFGTTLIGVNVALFFGSECAREFHLAIGLNPDLAPLSQVFLVVIFAELAPMFAARIYAEHVAMLGITLLYASTKVMTPFTWILGAITRLFSRRKGSESQIFLTQEELQKILEEQEEDQLYASDKDQFNAITSNIFSLSKKNVRQIMTPIHRVVTASSNCTVEEARVVFAGSKIHYLPIYHNQMHNIVGIASPRDLIRAADNRRVRDEARVPWFVTETTVLTHLLKQFRSNNQEVALILDEQGSTIGTVTLDDLVEEILGKQIFQSSKRAGTQRRVVVDRTFPGNMKVKEFNAQFDVVLDKNGDLTLEELIEMRLGYHPGVGESLYIYPFELIVKDTTLRGIKSVTITSKIE